MKNKPHIKLADNTSQWIITRNGKLVINEEGEPKVFEGIVEINTFVDKHTSFKMEFTFKLYKYYGIFS